MGSCGFHPLLNRCWLSVFSAGVIYLYVASRLSKMALFTRLEKCYMVAMSTKPAYTMDQLIDKAYTAILQTGLYKTRCVEYKGMETENQTSATLKEHMMQAFELRLQMGTAGGQNTVFNAMYNTTDDN